MNTASTPAATPADASGSMYSARPAVTPSPQTELFVHTATNALSDNFLYDAPVFLQLDSFDQIQASVFQLTRSPG